MSPPHDRAALLACFAKQSPDQSIAARQHTRLLSEPTSSCVVTGQQPAIGGGPLYTLVKISHAIAVAEARRQTGFNVVPIFWCASEDHDLGEASHADFIDRFGQVHRFAHSLGEGRASLRFRLAATWWEALVAHAQRVLGPGLGHSWLEQQRPSAEESMGQWTCRLLQQLFSKFGLLCIEGHHLRPLWSSHLQRAFDYWPTTELASLRTQLISAGNVDAFGQLLQPPLFADRADGRHALTVTEARELLSTEPLALSPGASLRPILQQAALPAEAYVAGPGEFAYHAFLTPIYKALRVASPTLIPRCSLSLISSAVARGLARWNCEPDALSHETPPIDITTAPHAFAHNISAIKQAITALEQQQTTPANARRLAAGIKRLQHDLHQIDASLKRQHQHDKARPAWGHLRGQLFPKNIRQERVMSLFQVIWEYGPGITEQLVAHAKTARPGQHYWMTVS
jgi:uncharacterized protein YllA (UPF0747 family)